MSSKQWIEQVIRKPAQPEPQPRSGKRVRLAETLLKMQKQKG